MTLENFRIQSRKGPRDPGSFICALCEVLCTLRLKRWHFSNLVRSLKHTIEVSCVPRELILDIILSVAWKCKRLGTYGYSVGRSLTTAWVLRTSYSRLTKLLVVVSRGLSPGDLHLKPPDQLNLFRKRGTTSQFGAAYGVLSVLHPSALGRR